jgi:hypothetical protein
MKKPNAKKSLCWTCKHGLCIQETEQEHIAYVNDPIVGNQSREDDYGLNLDSLLAGEPAGDQGDELQEHLVEHERVRTVCYYQPGERDTPPIAMSNVAQCNRYVKQDNK